MQQSNFFYFYYTYLKTLHEGSTRSEAFFAAQREYCLALLEDSALPIRGEGNYQFNLCNLLAYHNFGVMEPNAAGFALYDASGGIYRVSDGVASFVNGFVSSLVTEGTPQGEVTEFTELRGNNYAALHISRFTAQPLDNGYVRFTLAYAPSKPMRIELWNAPDMARLHAWTKTSEPIGPQELVFDLKEADVKAISCIVIQFSDGSDNSFSVEIYPSEQLGIEYVGNPSETQDGLPTTDAETQETGNLTRYGGNYADLHVQSFNAEALDDGTIRFTLTYAPPGKMDIEIRDWPDGDLFSFTAQSADSAEPQDLVFDLKAEDVKAASSIILYFNGSGDFFRFIEFRAENVHLPGF